MSTTLDSTCTVHPQVAIRPEPFGALAYHYGNRRLVFLRHRDVTRVVTSLADHATLRDALVANGIQETRWPSFVKAIDSLTTSGIIDVH